MMSLRGKNLCRFTRDLDEKLIGLVLQNEVIYDTNHKYYKDLSVRDNVWLAISSIVGKTVTECKTRWRSLRDLYHKKKKEQKSGKKLRTPWEYMESMKFLEKFTTEKRILPRAKSEETEEDEENNIENIKLEFEDIEPTASTSHHVYVANDEDPISVSKKRKLDETHFFYDNSAILHLLRENRELTKARENPIMAFFDSMAKTVIKFPPAQAAEVKLKVCQIVTEMECKIIEDTGNYPDQFEHYD